MRCGRRLEAVAYAAVPYNHAATAPALDEKTAPAPQQARRSAPDLVAVPGGATEPRQRSWQPSLFGTRDMGRVVSFEALSGTRPERPRKERTESVSRPRVRKPVPGQQHLGFADGPAATPRPHSMAPAPSGVIWCDAPVAIAAHRLGAAAIDAMFVVLALAAFVGVMFLLPGGNVLVHRLNWLMLASVAGVFWLLYHSLWCLANADPIGMRWSRLRTVNFDGRAPEREQRFSRMAAECLSVLAMGLGLLWSLVDEEALTWHDHISRTFPTPYAM